MRVPLQTEEEIADIIKDGERRFREGRTNTREEMSPFPSPTHLKTRHVLTRGVLALIPQLEIEKFHAMGDREEWRRLEDIRRCAISQIKEDSGAWIYIQFRIGRQIVQVIDIWEEETPEPVARPPTSVERAIAFAMDTFIVQLPEAQQEVIKLRFWSNLSIRDTAKQRHVMQETIRYLEQKGKRNLVRYFVEAGWMTGEQAQVMGVSVNV